MDNASQREAPPTTTELEEHRFCSAARATSASKILPYGPWSPTCGREERRLQMRGMSVVAYMLLGPGHPLWRTLRAGEDDAMAFVAAQEMVEALPSLHRRRLLSTHQAVTWPRRASP